VSFYTGSGKVSNKYFAYMAYFEPKGCRNQLFWEIIDFLIDLEKSLIKKYSCLKSQMFHCTTNSHNMVIDKFKNYLFYNFPQK